MFLFCIYFTYFLFLHLCLHRFTNDLSAKESAHSAYVKKHQNAPDPDPSADVEKSEDTTLTQELEHLMDQMDHDEEEAGSASTFVAKDETNVKLMDECRNEVFTHSDVNLNVNTTVQPQPETAPDSISTDYADASRGPSLNAASGQQIDPGFHSKKRNVLWLQQFLLQVQFVPCGPQSL